MGLSVSQAGQRTPGLRGGGSQLSVPGNVRDSSRGLGWATLRGKVGSDLDGPRGLCPRGTPGEEAQLWCPWCLPGKDTAFPEAPGRSLPAPAQRLLRGLWLHSSQRNKRVPGSIRVSEWSRGHRCPRTWAEERGWRAQGSQRSLGKGPGPAGSSLGEHFCASVTRGQ